MQLASGGDTIRVEIDERRVLIGGSARTVEIWKTIQRVAAADVSVLITGETGTGKELVARLIHKLSPRAAKPLVALDGTAVSPALLESDLFGHERGAFTGAERTRQGVFELADGSSLFLDEIANLPLEAQAKLLRVLQEREFRRLGGRELITTDFRLITATNADLAAAVRSGAFREDLFHRLKVIHLELPPLRERRDDVPLLVGHFLDQKRLRLNRTHVCRVSQEAVDLLASYDWPGNVRELENVLQAAILQCEGDTIQPRHLVFATSVAAPPADDLDLVFSLARARALATFERLYLFSQLRRFEGRVNVAAEHAGVTAKHIRALMRRHRIDRRDFLPPSRRRRPRPSHPTLAS